MSAPSMERIPILKMGDYLLVTIQVDMHDRLATTLQEDLADRIVTARARAVLIDISALEVVDSFIGRMLGSIAAIARVLDAEPTVRPNAHQRARQANLDEAGTGGVGRQRFAVQPDAPIHQRLANTERQLFALQVDHRTETDDVATRRFGVDIGVQVDEARCADLRRLMRPYVPAACRPPGSPWFRPPPAEEVPPESAPA